MVSRFHQWIVIVILVLLIIILVLFSNLCLKEDTAPDQKVLVGWLEKVYLPQYDFSLRGKMDTGAKNSSLHAVDIQYINEKGKPKGSCVRFKVRDTKGNYRIMQADLAGEARIKKSRTINEKRPAIAIESRPVVELEVCLAGITKRIQVNLTNRGGMNYRMLLGRSALAGDFTVDVSQKFIYGSGLACRKK